jgi:superfamily I DNA/RNA helicase
MKKYGLKPRDFAILVRKKAADYLKHLEPAFSARQIAIRNEAAQVGKVALQELFTELLSEILITVLRLISSKRAGALWTECLDAICSLQGFAFDDDDRREKAARALHEFSEECAESFPNPPADEAEAAAIVARVIDFVGSSNLLAASPAYRQGNWFNRVKEAVTLHLAASSKGDLQWEAALDAYEGLHAVPLMTVHKSKGLEYHTIVFVGLDDDAWFNFRKQSHEETAGFFVAFTRAKQRVIFTYCAGRGTRAQIAPLYELLKRGGIQTIKKG